MTDQARRGVGMVAGGLGASVGSVAVEEMWWENECKQLSQTFALALSWN